MVSYFYLLSVFRRIRFFLFFSKHFAVLLRCILVDTLFHLVTPEFFNMYRAEKKGKKARYSIKKNTKKRIIMCEGTPFFFFFSKLLRVGFHMRGQSVRVCMDGVDDVLLVKKKKKKIIRNGHSFPLSIQRLNGINTVAIQLAPTTTNTTLYYIIPYNTFRSFIGKR